jgi:CheY-like chemotaxis protein
MPEMSGFYLARSIRKSPISGQTPVAMLTQGNDVDAMRKGFAAGVTFFMTTPANRERAYALFKTLHGAMLTEWRRFVRLPYRIRVICEQRLHREKPFTAFTIDIGEGGMSLTPSEEVEVGEKSILEVVLLQVTNSTGKVVKRGAAELLLRVPPPPPPQSIRAVVRCKHPPGLMRVEFVSLPPGCREAIQNYVRGGGDY